MKEVFKRLVAFLLLGFVAFLCDKYVLLGRNNCNSAVLGVCNYYPTHSHLSCMGCFCEIVTA